MVSVFQAQEKSGSGRFAISLLLIVPSVLSFLASAALARDVEFPSSALWLMYEVSWYVGIVGAAIVIAMTVTGAVRRTVSTAFLFLMGIVAAAGIILVWYASHIYRSPWYS
jgi:hypothetical protein